MIQERWLELFGQPHDDREGQLARDFRKKQFEAAERLLVGQIWSSAQAARLRNLIDMGEHESLVDR